MRRFLTGILFLAASSVGAQTPSPALLVLEKKANTLAIVDPATLTVVGRAPAGPDPHEVEASPGGKLAYISNYGGSDGALHTISVVDLSLKRLCLPLISAHCILRMDWPSREASCISLRKRIRPLGVTILPRKPLTG